MSDSGNFDDGIPLSDENLDLDKVPMIDDIQPQNLMECISITSETNLLQVSENNVSERISSELIPFIDGDISLLEPNNYESDTNQQEMSVLASQSSELKLTTVSEQMDENSESSFRGTIDWYQKIALDPYNG